MERHPNFELTETIHEATRQGNYAPAFDSFADDIVPPEVTGDIATFAADLSPLPPVHIPLRKDDHAVYGWPADGVREKIRARIKDPKLAEKLVPADHTFHSKRPPGESGYYEAFDRDNVELVDVREDPIESITADGIKTRDHEFAFDVIIFATGWDVLTGALLAMDIRGEGGLTLDEKFADGLRTYLFAQTAGFPNLFLINASVSGSFVRAMEATIDWMADAMVHVRDSGYRSIAPTPQAEADWTVYVTKKITETIWGQSSSPLIGANIPGKPRVPLMPPDR